MMYPIHHMMYPVHYIMYPIHHMMATPIHHMMDPKSSKWEKQRLKCTTKLWVWAYAHTQFFYYCWAYAHTPFFYYCWVYAHTPIFYYCWAYTHTPLFYYCWSNVGCSCLKILKIFLSIFRLSRGKILFEKVLKKLSSIKYNRKYFYYLFFLKPYLMTLMLKM